MDDAPSHESTLAGIDLIGHGKVRDLYAVDDDWLLIVATKLPRALSSAEVQAMVDAAVAAEIEEKLMTIGNPVLWRGVSGDIEHGEVRVTLPRSVTEYRTLDVWWAASRTDQPVRERILTAGLPLVDRRGNSKISAEGRNLIFSEETSNVVFFGRHELKDWRNREGAGTAHIRLSSPLSIDNSLLTPPSRHSGKPEPMKRWRKPS